MKILSFGIAKEILGGAAVDVPLDSDVSVAMLQTRLAELYPGLRSLSSFMIAVNGEYAQPGTIINAGDEVAIIPPVSGG
jgi:molybdopterin synthase sulfur carrier subunit